MDGIQAATGTTYSTVLIAKTFHGKLAATLYRLPTIAYPEGFEGLLAEGLVSRTKAAAALGFYFVVKQMNRGLEQAQAAKQQPDDVILNQQPDCLNVRARAKCAGSMAASAVTSHFAAAGRARIAAAPGRALPLAARLARRPR